MIPFSDELRLGWAILLNAAIFASALRFTLGRGRGGKGQAVCDALLAWFVVQYAAISAPGCVGVLNAVTSSLVAVVASAALWWGAGRAQPSAARHRLQLTADHLGLIGCGLFAVAYVAVHVYDERWMPPMATDSLAYHLPAAVSWLQTGHISVFPTWYWNPANAWSPMGGSVFMAWLIAPLGNDAMARYVQVPALLLIFAVLIQLCRAMGCGRTAAGLVAIAAVLSRPFFSEALFAKDDLLATAFFAGVVLAFHPENLRDTLGAWRLGAAMGLLLASKYTTLLVCPLFLFLLDAPVRAGWSRRRWGIAAAVALLLAGPWYLRNVLMTGNPFFPLDVKLAGVRLFTGLYGSARDSQVHSVRDLWTMLSQTYHGLPVVLSVLLAGGWAAACAGAGRAGWKHPLPRACLYGSASTLLLFFAAPIHQEIRFIVPLILLFFASLGLALATSAAQASSLWLTVTGGNSVPRKVNRFLRLIPLAGAGILALASLATEYESGLLSRVATLSAPAIAIALAGVGLVVLNQRLLHLKPKALIAAGAAGAAMLAMSIFVFWHAYLTQYRDGSATAWEMGYGSASALWAFVRDNVPPGETVAYANTNIIYPYYGFDLSRPVVYAPSRRGLLSFEQLPRLGDLVAQEDMVKLMAAIQTADAYPATWLQNLTSRHAGYLVIEKPGLRAAPPERHFAAAMPERFIPIYDSADGAVFRIISR